LTRKNAENNVNYQERAREFAPGDYAVPYGHTHELAGRVTAVWPGIGMVDVEFTAGNKRYPVEDLQKVNIGESSVTPPSINSAPGGQPTVSVPGGPREEDARQVVASLSRVEPRRVAEAFVKRALYWHSADRRYRASLEETGAGEYRCPKCKDSTLRPATYKRRGGQSEKLLGCPECLFLIKRQDIIGDPGYVDPDEAKKPFANLQVKGA
jgi:hypothetical protein